MKVLADTYTNMEKKELFSNRYREVTGARNKAWNRVQKIMKETWDEDRKARCEYVKAYREKEMKYEKNIASKSK